MLQTKDISQPRNNFERYLSHNTKTHGFRIQLWLLFYIPVFWLSVFQEFSHTPNTVRHYLVSSLLKISASARLPRCDEQSTQTCHAFLGRILASISMSHARTACPVFHVTWCGSECLMKPDDRIHACLSLVILQLGPAKSNQRFGRNHRLLPPDSRCADAVKTT